MTALKRRIHLPENDTITIVSAKIGVRIANTPGQSASGNAEYSDAVVRDGKSLGAYIIEKRTGKTQSDRK